MADSTYVFSNAAPASELDRLQAIEARYDPRTRRGLRDLGVGPGAACLEVGPGAGSILRWMAEVVGKTGRAVGLEVAPRPEALQQGLALIQGDIVDWEAEAEAFDVVHARYVLLHVRDAARAMANMVRALKPGGWLLVEEPDFATAAAVSGEGSGAVERVNEAILRMYGNLGRDPRLGRRLPAMMQAAGLREVAVEADLPLAPGGSDIARIMRMSAEHLASRYLAAGPATAQDIQTYVGLADDPSAWATWYATFSARGRRPTH